MNMGIETLPESFVVVSQRLKQIDSYEYMILVRDHMVRWLNEPGVREWMNLENAKEFARHLPKAIAAWEARIRYVKLNMWEYWETFVSNARGGTAFEAAMARITAQEAALTQAARMASLNAAATAAEGTLVAGVGTTIACVVVPVVGMVAVQMALGAGYAQAREQARKDGYASGFAKGLITGLLKWELRFVIERFWDDAKDKNAFDEELPKIRANAHNQALIHGRVAGLARTDKEKKDYLLALRKLTKTSTAGWTPWSTGNEYRDWLQRERAKVVQSSYVIELAGAATKYGFTAVF
jgi:hypothetical protein